MTQTTFPQTLARMDGERMRAYRDNLSFYQGDQWRGAPLDNQNARLPILNFVPKPVLSLSKEPELFPIFSTKWFAFSFATRHNVGNNSPSQAHHHSTVKRHFTPIKRFQNTQNTTYVKR